MITVNEQGMSDMGTNTSLIGRTVAKAQARLFEARLARIAPKVRFEPEKAIVISANPRGGSTWLFEALKHIPNTASLLEPLHKRWADDVNHLGFDWHQRIPEEADWPEARSLFERRLSGQTLNAKMCQHSPASSYKTAERLVVKFVRANGLLPWLVRQFAFETRPVVMTRHPFAMAASMLRHPNWQTMPKRYVFPDAPFMDYSPDDRAFLEELTTPEEVMVAKWCTRNRNLLRHPGHNRDWITIHYEYLLLHQEDTMRYLFAEWGMPVPVNVLASLKRPSREAREPDYLDDKATQLEKWTERFEPDQQARLQRIMDHFEIDLYGRDVMPNPDSSMVGHHPL